MKKAILALADGTIFNGYSLGATGETIGEIVFTTGMVGYLETMTDPSCSGLIVAMTYPVIGNYGVNREDCQSDKVQVRGLIMKEVSDFPSNFRCQETLEEYLISENVIAITGIDTRALTKIIRNKGAINGMITTDENFDFEEHAEKIRSYKVASTVDSCSATEQTTYGEGSLHVALMDYGMKKNLLAPLLARGAKVTVYPASTPAEAVLADNPDGILLSNGPGNPTACTQQIAEVKALIESKKPLLGISLGHQLAALAMGGQTEKLPFGHRGANQPVKDFASGRTFITTQNHGYVVTKGSLAEDVAELTHVNVNDGTVEGLRYKNYPAVTVQFHPEAKPGTKDTGYLYDEFFAMMEGKCNA
ncbi:MAG: carbamoyl phosphate synthase small subunit [Ruminococcaceae bacterium]|nr:carbamoyl phosphate synthase small subunit [Oscillospiraceae bacterium]